jgi:cell division protein FtsN
VRFSREGRYYIQVGSHTELGKAIRQRERLRMNAYPAFIREVDLGRDGRWFRVMVGRYQDLEKAAEEADRLKKSEKLTPRIIKEGDTADR